MEALQLAATLGLLCAAVLGTAGAVTFEVKEGNSTCIKAELSALISVTYSTSSSTSSVSVPLPGSASVDTDSSSCGAGGGAPWLLVAFGSGHALGLSFSTDGSVYSIAALSLQYNLSDASLFPDANSSAVVTLVNGSVGIWAPLNTTYRCLSPIQVGVGGAGVTLFDMRLEAYMAGNQLSPTDQTTTAPPTTASVTTAMATPAPAGAPTVRVYSVSDANGTVCLLAKMALQLNVSYSSRAQNKTVQELFNLKPNLTTSSGLCGASSASLVLEQEQSTTLSFTFTMNATSSEYYLSGIQLLANWSDMSAPLAVTNSRLEFLRSPLGRSYLCSSEQTLPVAPGFSLNTFQLQVQPFGVTASRFSAAEECRLDQDQMLIPIIVGAALAGLVLVVLMAYLVGRRRGHAGYQTI